MDRVEFGRDGGRVAAPQVVRTAEDDDRVVGARVWTRPGQTRLQARGHGVGALADHAVRVARGSSLEQPLRHLDRRVLF